MIDFDLQLLAIGSSIIVTVLALVGGFLYFGNRERSFEEVYGDRRGLNILLDAQGADQSSSSGGGKTGKAAAASKDHHQKKKKPVQQQQTNAAKKPEKKQDAETTPGPEDQLFGAHQHQEDSATFVDQNEQKRKTLGTDSTDEVLMPALDAPSQLGTQATAAKPTKKKGKKDKGAAKKSFDEYETAGVEEQQNFNAEGSAPIAAETFMSPIVADESDAIENVFVAPVNAQQQQQKGGSTAASNNRQQNGEEISSSPPPPHPPPPQHLVFDAGFESAASATVAAAPSKKKKQKKAATSDLAASEEILQKQQHSKPDLDNGDNSINAALRRLNLPPLTEDQCEIVASFYAEQMRTANNTARIAPTMMMDGPTEMAFLKKIEEKDRLLNQEKHRVATTLQTINNLNQEMINEKNRNATAERQMKEQFGSLQTENQQLSQQIREFQTQMANKMQTYHQMENQLRQLRSMEQNHNVQMQQLREENQRFKERAAANEQDLLNRNAEMQRLKQELMNRDQQVLRLEKQRNEMDQMRALQDATLTQQMVEAKNTIMIKEQEYVKMEDELKTLRQQCSTLEHELQSVNVKFDEQVQQTFVQQQQALESGTKKDMDRLVQEMEELRRLYQNESAKNENLREEMERESSKRLKEKDEQLANLIDEKELSMHKLQEETQNLRNQLENLSHEKDATSDVRYKELEQALNLKNKLDLQLADAKSDLNAVSSKLKTKEQILSEMETKLKLEQDERKEIETSLAQLRKELESVKASQIDSDEHKQQIEHLDTTLARRNATIKNLEEQVKDQISKLDYLDGYVHDLTNKIDQLSMENRKLTDQLQNWQNNNVAAAYPIANGHASDVAGVIIDPQVLKVSEHSMSQLSKQLILKDAEINNLKQDIDGLRQKNNILREEKYKAVEAVQQMEKNVKTLVDKSSETKNRQDNNNSSQNFELETRQVLSTLLPNYKSPTNKITYKEWLCDYESKLKQFLKSHEQSQSEKCKVIEAQQESSKAIAKDNELNKKLNDLSLENSNLRATLDSLVNLLHKTEKLLTDLEKKAQQDEREMASKNADNERRINQLKQDTCSCLQEQLKSSAQVESQLHSFKITLEEEKLQRDSLLKDLQERSALLEQERQAAKDLEAQVVKWKGMVKISQDSYKQEQNLVSQLEAKLKTLQDTNGGKAVFDELEELRKKLQQKEQQLDKEMQINKQLNNKLESLGVAVPFNSV